MAEAFAPLSWWLRSGKHRELRKAPKGSSINTLPEMEVLEVDKMKHGQNIASSSRRGVKRKWERREERKIDKEHDIVLVPSDGGCVSGSESDDTDWSIGWVEPHGSGFNSDGDSDDSFAVLVPCYGRGCLSFEDDSKDKVLGTIGNITDIYAAGNKKYMEQWLSSLRNI
ncbi:PREDICTED: uncharacterized protein LOC109152801 [Ipomoea nil]|uniref:uncharacterized protein LOC109152801 n=1 Tax=Ipomoea nil TaxID=35883 RepID=UPI00090096B7|nr:PREDICTED: uncharacterized protein LOC109152801 [Ipomoea nil]XP_019155993.1 PREDICTED: uncharacterized protein LOC109152801 [Ipomoea nil]